MYTGKGDDGKTYLYSGKRVHKDNPRVEAYGSIDELNSWLGLVASITKDEKLRNILKEIQSTLFVVSGELASEGVRETPRISRKEVERLELLTNEIYQKLPRLTKFILPGGSMLSSILHIARTVCRRAERRVVTLSKKTKINKEIIPYLNRLSSLLFNMARYVNSAEGIEEELWEH